MTCVFLSSSRVTAIHPPVNASSVFKRTFQTVPVCHVTDHTQASATLGYTKKTKIMIFNKSGRMIRLNIRIGELMTESCFQYTYLGTVFTPNNNFKKAQSELYKKVC